jgi:hypothetical protein
MSPTSASTASIDNPNPKETIMTKEPTVTTYSKNAVDKAIASSNRFGRRIGSKEARLIHALLKGPTYPTRVK